MFPAIKHRVVWEILTDVSEEFTASIIRVMKTIISLV
jgi:hypothetical protein